jgi:hypothetical protein
MKFPLLVGNLEAGFCSGNNRVHAALGFAPFRVAFQRHMEQAQAVANLVGINREDLISDVCPVVSVAMPATRTNKTEIAVVVRGFTLAIEYFSHEGGWKNAFVLATRMFAL